VLPTEMRVGDDLLLPGVRAEGFQQQLLTQREAERRAAVAYAQQLKYERFVAWKKDQARQRAQAAAARQEQYDRFLAWQASEERQAKIRAYEQQVQYEAAQAAARQRAQAAARLAAARPTTARVTESRVVLQQASTGAAGLAWPMASYRITSRFGDRDIAFHREVFHGGVDLAAAYGSPIYAAMDGEVTLSGYGDFGLNVFTVNGNSTIIYGHLSRTAVVAGQRVSQGQLLGYVGCSGICTGPHLHFEVRLGGHPVDPLALLP
jgi:murein DD-endopeptidase MepM/ murein hydrolase activator NlpD